MDELGIDPKLPQHDKLDALYDLGFVHLPKAGLPTYRRYLATGDGIAVQDIWAYQPYTRGVTRVPGTVPNQRQVGDGGIDGRGTLPDGGIVLAQVKGSKAPALGHVRDFRHVLAREDAACGMFATLRPVTSAKVKQEVHGAGHLQIGANRYPKAQLWSIADYFQDRLPILPPLADPYTGQPMQLDILES